VRQNAHFCEGCGGAAAGRGSSALIERQSLELPFRSRIHVGKKHFHADAAMHCNIFFHNKIRLVPMRER
jgi:hypothetical protein